MENYISVVMQNLILILKMADLKKKGNKKKTHNLYSLWIPFKFCEFTIASKKIKNPFSLKQEVEWHYKKRRLFAKYCENHQVKIKTFFLS